MLQSSEGMARCCVMHARCVWACYYSMYTGMQKMAKPWVCAPDSLLGACLVQSHTHAIHQRTQCRPRHWSHQGSLNWQSHLCLPCPRSRICLQLWPSSHPAATQRQTVWMAASLQCIFRCLSPSKVMTQLSNQCHPFNPALGWTILSSSRWVG